MLRDPGARDTRVNQHMPDFSRSIRLFFRSQGLVLELTGEEIDLVFGSLVGMISFYELPVFRSVKVRGFEGSRPQDARGVVVFNV